MVNDPGSNGSSKLSPVIWGGIITGTFALITTCVTVLGPRIFDRFFPAPTDVATAVPADTPRPSPAVRTNVPGPEPTAISTVTEIGAAERVILLQDDFSSNRNGWNLEPTEGDDYNRTVVLVDEKLRVTVATKPGAATGFSTGNWVPFGIIKDFYLSVEATLVEAPDGAGLVFGFRDDGGENAYRIYFRNTGLYELWLLKDNEWQPAIRRGNFGDAMSLDVGEKNLIVLTVKDSAIAISVNGQDLAAVLDDRLDVSGQIWIGANVPQANQIVTVDFDNILITEE